MSLQDARARLIGLVASAESALAAARVEEAEAREAEVPVRRDLARLLLATRQAEGARRDAEVFLVDAKASLRQVEAALRGEGRYTAEELEAYYAGVARFRELAAARRGQE